MLRNKLQVHNQQNHGINTTSLKKTLSDIRSYNHPSSPPLFYLPDNIASLLLYSQDHNLYNPYIGLLSLFYGNFLSVCNNRMLSSQGNQKRFSSPVCTAPASPTDTTVHGSPYPSVLKASAWPPEYEAHCPDDQTSQIPHEQVPEAAFSPCGFRCIGYSKRL